MTTPFSAPDSSSQHIGTTIQLALYFYENHCKLIISNSAWSLARLFHDVNITVMAKWFVRWIRPWKMRNIPADHFLDGPLSFRGWVLDTTTRLSRVDATVTIITYLRQPGGERYDGVILELHIPVETSRCLGTGRQETGLKWTIRFGSVATDKRRAGWERGFDDLWWNDLPSSVNGLWRGKHAGDRELIER